MIVITIMILNMIVMKVSKKNLIYINQFINVSIIGSALVRESTTLLYQISCGFLVIILKMNNGEHHNLPRRRGNDKILI